MREQTGEITEKPASSPMTNLVTSLRSE